MDKVFTFDLLPVAAIVISLLLAYFPRLKTWWTAVDSGNKQTYLLGLYALISLGAWGLSQVGLVEIYPLLDTVTWQESVRFVLVDFATAVGASIVTYESTNRIGNRG